MFTLAGELSTRKCGAVYAITPSAATHGDNQIAGARFLVRFVARNQPDISTVHERGSQIALIEVNGPVDRRNSHSIAIVANALDDSPHHSPRVQRARRQLLHWRIRRCEAEHIGSAVWIGAEAG